MFEKLLALSEAELGHPVEMVQRFQQPGRYGMCSTLVIRWIKYKLVSNPRFWDKLVVERAIAITNDPLDARDLVGVKLGKIQKKQFHYEKLVSEAGRSGRVAKQAFGGELHGEFALKTLTGHLTKDGVTRPKQKELFSKFIGQERIEISRRPFTRHSPSTIARNLTREGCASYIFLSTNIEGSSDAHVLGTFCSRGKISFFDPNMGEIALANFDFANWFARYMQHWPAAYNKLDHYYVAHVRGIPI